MLISKRNHSLYQTSLVRLIHFWLTPDSFSANVCVFNIVECDIIKKLTKCKILIHNKTLYTITSLDKLNAASIPSLDHFMGDNWTYLPRKTIIES